MLHILSTGICIYNHASDTAKLLKDYKFKLEMVSSNSWLFFCHHTRCSNRGYTSDKQHKAQYFTMLNEIDVVCFVRLTHVLFAMLIIKLVSHKQHSHNHLFANDNWRDEFLLIIVADLVFFFLERSFEYFLLALPFNI